MKIIKLLTLILVVALPGFKHWQASPNIIFILVDDQGWTDLGIRMDSDIADSASDYYETPNIDRLARQSLRFSAGYSPSPICTPSRASLLTGKSPQQLGFTDIIESRPGGRRFSDLYAGKKLIGPQPVPGMPEEEITIAEIITERVKTDYAKAHFGKWHVGGGGPGRHGFDTHDGSTGNHNFNAHSADPNPKDVFGITGRAIAYMKSQVNSGRPFYMQLSHYANHVPLSALGDTVAKYKAKDKGVRHSNPVYAALNEDLDTSVGRLMDALEELGIADNTYIFYMSDNGGSKNIRNPSTNNAPLREGKTWVYEGGIRVPFMVLGPGIAPGESAVPIIGWDLLPTFCAISGCEGELPPGIEGGNLLPLLTGVADEVKRPRGEALFWHFPHYIAVKGTTPQSAIRVGEFKLIKFYHYEKTELYNLVTDIGETTDVSAQYPQIAKTLERRLDDYLSDIGAAMPRKNTEYPQ
ncbi:MAG: sulfatase [Gammaproteobacteria bacterium]